jgi:hypothetical protein
MTNPAQPPKGDPHRIAWMLTVFSELYRRRPDPETAHIRNTLQRLLDDPGNEAGDPELHEVLRILKSIEATSLGTPGARAVRDNSNPLVAAEVISRVRELERGSGRQPEGA